MERILIDKIDTDFGYVCELNDNSRIVFIKKGELLPATYYPRNDMCFFVLSGSLILKYVDKNDGNVSVLENVSDFDRVSLNFGEIFQIQTKSDTTLIELFDRFFPDKLIAPNLFSNNSVKNNRGVVFHTLNDKIIDLSNFDYDKSQAEVEREYGWEAAMYWSNLYHKDLIKFFDIPKNGVFVDIGANIGMSSMLAELSGAGKIYSVEPDPNIYKALIKNKGDNWVCDNIAISDDKKDIKIKEWPYEDILIVPSVTLNQYIELYNLEKIDYLKIDVEGYEFDILRRLSYDNWLKIDRLFLEYHEDVFNYSDDFRDSLIHMIVLNGEFKNHHIVLGKNQSLFYFWR